MASLVTPVSGDLATAELIAQLTELFSGLRNIPVSLTGTNDASAYALTLKNAGTGSKGLIVYAADGTTVLLQIDSNGLLASRTGGAAERMLTAVAPVVTSGGLTVTAGGLTVTAGGLTVTAGGLTVTAGTVDVTAGPLRVGGGTYSTTGALRFANNSFLAWRNNGNTNDMFVGVDTLDRLVLGQANVFAIATTIGAAGGAAAQPATPLGYLRVVLNNTEVKIPYHNA